MPDEENNTEKSEEKLPTQKETIAEFEEKIKKLEKEKEDYLSGWKRAKADLLNFQKETDEKLKNIVLFANSNFAFDLLVILDSFDLALNSLTEKDKETSVGNGYYMIQTQLLDILRKYGIEIIETKGRAFNPNFHEAIDTKICDKKDCDKTDEGAILEVLSKGYLLHGKLLRPTKVRVITHN